MADAPHRGDRQGSTLPGLQRSIQNTNRTQPLEKYHAASEEEGARNPFAPQLNAFSQASSVPPSQHGSLFACYRSQQSTHGFDTGSMSLAFPGPGPPALVHSNGVAVQHAGMSFRPQIPTYSGQAYSSMMAMYPPEKRGQTHSSTSSPGHYYNPHGVSTPQACIQPQRHLAAGYTTLPKMSYGHDVDVQKSYPRPYSSHFGQSFETEPTPSYPRGPPRKPKQSGHALWVGNLPPSTTVGALKDHFSREATDDIESVFLISKSNCAFVNYQSETACFAAMGRFHNSRFQGLHLVCRPRQSTPVSGSSHSIGPTNWSSGIVVEASPQIADSESLSGLVIVDGSASHSPEKEPQQDVTINLDGVDGYGEHSNLVSAQVPEKYFVVKSLTLQDLEASVRSGVWASQSRNKAALNHAYEAAENVFLVFSANKSGEYFGYARMISPITSAAIPCSTSLQPEKRDMGTGPKSILTPATQWAPRGHILDDSARGTIFWEAERGEAGYGFGDTQAPRQEEGWKQLQDWGESFEVEWISTTRLSFYRTRGLRNPWNENKEIKVARDGTEIEPSIGRRLVQMFHQSAQPFQGARSRPPNITPTTPHLP